MKLIKGIVISVIALVVLLLAAVLAHPYWIGSTVKLCAEKVGPVFTGTPITLQLCEFNLYKGLVGIEGFTLDNPNGTQEKIAASLGTARFQIDPISLATDVIVIKEITVKDLFASYEKLGEKTNFDIIAEHAAGPKKPAQEGEATTKVEEPTVSTEKTEVADNQTTQPEARKTEKKVIIEKLTISGAKISYMGFPIVIPVDINLTDIGKDSGGITLGSALVEIAARIMNAGGLVGGQLKDLGLKGLDIGQTGLDVGTAGVTNAIEAVKNMDVEGAAAIIKETGDSLKTSGKDFKKLGKEFKGLFK